MLDKTIPYYGVIMIKDDVTNYPVYNLPDDYSFFMYEKGLENDWAKLKTSVGEFDNIEYAKKYFQSEFCKNESSCLELLRRCIFVKNKSNEVVGTTTLWYGDLLGETMQRVHWVSVHPDHQGKGIAKALITKALDIYNHMGYNGKIYLTTQTWSYIAINIYLKFGFKPYNGLKPKMWKTKEMSFQQENQIAWDIIFKKIDKNFI